MWRRDMTVGMAGAGPFLCRMNTCARARGTKRSARTDTARHSLLNTRTLRSALQQRRPLCA